MLNEREFFLWGKKMKKKKKKLEKKRVNKGFEREGERETVGLLRHRRAVWANATGCDTFKKSQHVNQK